MREELEGFLTPGSEEAALADLVDFENIPGHVAVIMDGNGRWARAKGLPRIEGHIAGAKSVKEIVETGARLGIEVLTLYAFSKENWKRPDKEVSRLWKLLGDYLRNEDNTLMENKLRFRVIGQREGIPDPVVREIERVEKTTKDNGRMTVVLALNYGGRSEIVDAVRRILREKNIGPEDVDEDRIARFLYTDGLPDPDLLIRTSGELRVSNFLLWQIAYSEIWITPVLWPDFRKIHLIQAILEYQKRDRRFGDVHSRRGQSA
jgi:undecaprenyl diphosphate synthase